MASYVQHDIRKAVKKLFELRPAKALALGLGIGTKIWQDVFMGADLLLRPERAASGGDR